MEENNTSSAVSNAAASKEFETDSIISLVTRRAIKDGMHRVGAAINYVCSLNQDGSSFFYSSGPFAPIAREFLQQRLPALNNVSVEKLDARLAAEKKNSTLSFDRADEIVTGWMKGERTRLGLGEKIEVPKITRADTTFFNRTEVIKRQIAEAAAKHKR